MSDYPILKFPPVYLLPEEDPSVEIDWFAHVRELPKQYRPYYLLLLPPLPPDDGKHVWIRKQPVSKAGKHYYKYITNHLASRMQPPEVINAPETGKIYTNVSHLIFHARSSAFAVTADTFQPPQMIVHNAQPVWKLADGTLVPANPMPMAFGDCSSFCYVGHLMPSRCPQTLPGLEEETEFGPEDRAIYGFIDVDFAGAPKGRVRVKIGFSDDMYQRQQTLQSGAIGHIQFAFKVNPGKFKAKTMENLSKKALAHRKVAGPKGGERFDLTIFELNDIITCSGSTSHFVKLLSVISTPDARAYYAELDGRYVTGKIVRDSHTRRINIDENTHVGVIHQEQVPV